jgi:hypothetical protein
MLFKKLRVNFVTIEKAGTRKAKECEAEQRHRRMTATGCMVSVEVTTAGGGLKFAGGVYD